MFYLNTLAGIVDGAVDEGSRGQCGRYKDTKGCWNSLRHSSRNARKSEDVQEWGRREVL